MFSTFRARHRRKISRQLNKGESPHALRRDLLYAHDDETSGKLAFRSELGLR
ncbi:hypothetical protein [Nocardia sp. NPDC051463]|uniref:hypothetical protein n=1 Tax=Nocardia sp. NPDC051463 TaxID=3154845 RepID=UPI00344DF032